jgi:hypothetical protein
LIISNNIIPSQRSIKMMMNSLNFSTQINATMFGWKTFKRISFSDFVASDWGSILIQSVFYRYFLQNDKQQMSRISLISDYEITNLLINYLHYDWSDSLSQWKNNVWNENLWSRMLTIMILCSSKDDEMWIIFCYFFLFLKFIIIIKCCSSKKFHDKILLSFLCFFQHQFLSKISLFHLALSKYLKYDKLEFIWYIDNEIFIWNYCSVWQILFSSLWFVLLMILWWYL